MKFCVLILLALVNVSWQKQEFGDVLKSFGDNLAKMQQPCIEESQVDPEKILGALVTGNFPDDDRNLKCFFKCISSQMKVVDGSGQIDEEVLRTRIPLEDKAQVERAVQKCKGVSGKDECDKSYALTKCIYFALKELLVE